MRQKKITMNILTNARGLIVKNPYYKSILVKEIQNREKDESHQNDLLFDHLEPSKIDHPLTQSLPLDIQQQSDGGTYERRLAIRDNGFL